MRARILKDPRFKTIRDSRKNVSYETGDELRNHLKMNPCKYHVYYRWGVAGTHGRQRETAEDKNRDQHLTCQHSTSSMQQARALIILSDDRSSMEFCDCIARRRWSTATASVQLLIRNTVRNLYFQQSLLLNLKD